MIATGFDFEPLPNGDVLIEFCGDDGVMFNTRVTAITTSQITRGVLSSPLTITSKSGPT